MRTRPLSAKARDSGQWTVLFQKLHPLLSRTCGFGTKPSTGNVTSLSFRLATLTIL